jgi:glycosyltransferase involved in cell wall biosynthesis
MLMERLDGLAEVVLADDGSKDGSDEPIDAMLEMPR